MTSVLRIVLGVRDAHVKYKQEKKKKEKVIDISRVLGFQ